MVRCWLPGLEVRERMPLVRLRSCKVQPGRTNKPWGEREKEGAKQCDLESLWEKNGYIDFSQLLLSLCKAHARTLNGELCPRVLSVAQARSTLQCVHDSLVPCGRRAVCVSESNQKGRTSVFSLPFTNSVRGFFWLSR